MRIRTILLSLIAGLTLVSLMLLGTANSRAYLIVAANPPQEADPEETPLNIDGSAYEINIDAAGNLWISDYGADEIWQVNPATAAYTIYQGIQAPSDARRDPVRRSNLASSSKGRSRVVNTRSPSRLRAGSQRR